MLRLFLVGFGNVAREVVRLLCSDREIFKDFNRQNFVLTAITTRNHGSLFSGSGLNGAEALDYFRKQGRFDARCAFFNPLESETLLRQAEYDVLVDLSTLELQKRASQTTQRLEWALQNQRHVVTANKGPIAFHYRKLKKLALKNQRQLLFESTVMDGTPLFNLYKNSLHGAKVVAFSGIVNSTTNFLLTQMEKGQGLAHALTAARKAGMVEANAEHDLQGWDAALKTAILCNVFFDAQVDPLQIGRDSFDLVTAAKIAMAKKQGKRWKFVVSARKQAAKIEAKVALQLLNVNHPFFNISESSSVLQLELENLATMRIVQHRPTITDTAYGVIADLLEVLKQERKQP